MFPLTMTSWSDFKSEDRDKASYMYEHSKDLGREFILIGFKMVCDKSCLVTILDLHDFLFKCVFKIIIFTQYVLSV